MPQTIKAQLSGLIISTFQFENQKNKKVFNYLLLFVIFCFGLVLWLKFLNSGVIPTDRLDWLHVTFPRLTAIKQSLLTLQFPLHLADPTAINGITDRFLAIPDLIFSPDILLMRFISISDFIQIHVLICYGIGYFGLLQIRKYFKLSFTAFFLLFMVFNFNGFIVSHIAVGHLTWGAYFVLPFFLLLIIEFFKNAINRLEMGFPICFDAICDLFVGWLSLFCLGPFVCFYSDAFFTRQS